MVIQNKKIGGIQMCVDFWELNKAFLHAPFPTPFIEEILESTVGREIYSFIDDFFGYC